MITFGILTELLARFIETVTHMQNGGSLKGLFDGATSASEPRPKPASANGEIVRRALRLKTAVFVLATLNLANLTAFAQFAEIPDTGLRQAMCTALNKPMGDLTVAEVESLTTLDASRSKR